MFHNRKEAVHQLQTTKLKRRNTMKKLFSFATALIIMAGIASSALAQTEFDIIVQLGDGASIGLFSDSDCTIPMTDLTLDMTGITFPFNNAVPSDNDGYYDPHAIAKTYVKVSASGTGWAVITYTTNNPDNSGLLNTVDSSKDVPLKYAASNRVTCPEIGAVLTHDDFVSYTWFTNLSGTGDEYADQDSGTQTYMQCIVPGEVSASNNVVDITLVMGLTISRTTPGSYATHIAFEVVGN